MRNILHASLFCGSIISVIGCTKVTQVEALNDTVASGAKRNVSICQPISFYSESASGPEIQYTTVFKRWINSTSGKPDRVLAGISSGGAIVDSILFSLVWEKNRVSFLRDGSPGDTVLVAYIDKNGLPLRIIAGNKPDENFLPTSFQYRSGKISRMLIAFNGSQLVADFYYDKNGNCIRIQEKGDGTYTPGRVEYTYSTSSKASGQIYADEPRGFSWNTYSLAEYSGLLSQNQPVNLRTGTMVVWEDNYVVYDMAIRNHQIDTKGNLISYDVVDPVDNSTATHHTIGWSCSRDGNRLLQ